MYRMCRDLYGFNRKMYKIEIKKTDEDLLKCELEKSDYPVVNLQIRNDELKTKLLFKRKEIIEKEKSTHNKFSLDITISEDSLALMMGKILNTTDFFSNLHIEQLSMPVRMIIHDIMNCSCDPKFKHLYLRTKVCELLICILSVKAAARLDLKFTAQERSVFKRLKNVISGNLHQHYSIDELAQIAGMNRTKIQTGFKAIFGKTIHTYTLDLKMQKAKHLLTEDPNVSLKEVAAKVGYKYANHFSTAFKKKFKFSPSLFKKGNLLSIIYAFWLLPNL
ncbi:hypothetical protein DBR11_04050 [Pedobacter sp. HMWF019]|nr:hypothetical protein DBR11_04050 [Pedobacter sp. HMWF019]